MWKVWQVSCPPKLSVVDLHGLWCFLHAHHEFHEGFISHEDQSFHSEGPQTVIPQYFSFCDLLVEHMKHIYDLACPGELSVSGQSASSVKCLENVLLAAEAECAERSQAARSLSGVLEVDGTSIRKFKVPNSTTLRYLQYIGALQRGQRVLNPYQFEEAR